MTVHPPSGEPPFELTFPLAYQYSKRQGLYTVPDPSLLLSAVKLGPRPSDALDMALLRLELAAALLWPRVAELFTGDMFPHLLDCIDDELHAVAFIEDEDGCTRLLADEAAAALAALESNLAGQPLAQAADPGAE